VNKLRRHIIKNGHGRDSKMKASEFITEAFDSIVPYEVTRATNDLFTTRAEINNRNIIFNAQGNDEGNGFESNVVWEVDFYEKTPGNMSFGLTGAGGEMKVFSFIIDSLKELKARYSPETIRFTSHKADGNRTKLYQRMIDKIAPSIGYKLSDIKSSTADDVFVLTSVKEDVEIKEDHVADVELDTGEKKRIRYVPTKKDIVDTIVRYYLRQGLRVVRVNNTEIEWKPPAPVQENFADGKKPGRKGLAKRSGVNTKASVSSLRKTAKNSSGEKQRMAHWLANMKAGRAKKNK